MRQKDFIFPLHRFKLVREYSVFIFCLSYIPFNIVIFLLFCSGFDGYKRKENRSQEKDFIGISQAGRNNGISNRKTGKRFRTRTELYSKSMTFGP